jgi:hypothetical protein
MRPNGRLSDKEQRLVKLFRALGPPERATLLAFAAFLTHREPEIERPPIEPEPLPRPAEETVVAAMKRLSQTYSMLERDALLGEAAGLMSAHLLQGRVASEVIDELEALFARYYAAYREAFPEDRS